MDDLDPVLDIILADISVAAAPEQETLIDKWNNALALAHARDHGLSDPRAAIKAYLLARDCGHDIPEFALAGVATFLRTGKPVKAARWREYSIMAAAARAVRDREHEISRRDVAIKMLALLKTCSDYTGDCTHMKAVNRMEKWLQRHEAETEPHPDWLMMFENALDH